MRGPQIECPECGTHAGLDNSFCRGCGRDLRDVDVPLWHQPAYRDWLFIASGVATVVIAITGTLAEYTDPVTQEVEVDSGLAFAIDLVLRSGFYFLILGLAPALIRRAVRRRRRT